IHRAEKMGTSVYALLSITALAAAAASAQWFCWTMAPDMFVDVRQHRSRGAAGGPAVIRGRRVGPAEGQQGGRVREIPRDRIVDLRGRRPGDLRGRGELRGRPHHQGDAAPDPHRVEVVERAM